MLLLLLGTQENARLNRLVIINIQLHINPQWVLSKCVHVFVCVARCYCVRVTILSWCHRAKLTFWCNFYKLNVPLRQTIQYKVLLK